MKSKSADKIKMPSIDELLGVSGEESATDIEISRIHSFANHPFKVLDDDKMDDLVESIKQNGVLTPSALVSAAFTDIGITVSKISIFSP